MKLKSNKGFSLIEVLITTGILSTGIVFVFSSFTAVISAVKLSQNMTFACLLTENKMWEAQQVLASGSTPQPSSTESIQGKDFKWSFESLDTAFPKFRQLKFGISWKETLKEKDYTLEILSYSRPL